MRLSCSINIATDTHSPYAMIIAVGYMRIPHRNIRPTLSFWLKIREILSYTIRPTIHAVTIYFRFSQRFNNIPFLLLYKSTLLVNRLQTFRENVGVSFFKGTKCPTQFFPSKIQKKFSSKNSGNNCTVTSVSNRTFYLGRRDMRKMWHAWQLRNNQRNFTRNT